MGNLQDLFEVLLNPSNHAKSLDRRNHQLIMIVRKAETRAEKIGSSKNVKQHPYTVLTNYFTSHGLEEIFIPGNRQSQDV